MELATDLLAKGRCLMIDMLLILLAHAATSPEHSANATMKLLALPVPVPPCNEKSAGTLLSVGHTTAESWTTDKENPRCTHVAGREDATPTMVLQHILYCMSSCGGIHTSTCRVTGMAD